MAWKQAHAVSVMFALTLSAAFASQAYAGSCEGSDRIPHKEADCLNAGWSNNYDDWSSGKVWAKNFCHEHGTVVAKVDIKDGKDLTWYMKSSKKYNKKTGWLDIRGVYCCADLSDFCNESEIYDADCTEQYESSAASDTCSREVISAPTDDTCVVEAVCQRQHPWGTYSKATSRSEITTSFSNMSKLHNCDAELQVGKC